MADDPRYSRRLLLLSAAGITIGGVQTYRYVRGRASSDPAPPTPPTSPTPKQPELWAADFGTVADGLTDDGPALRRALAGATAAGPGAVLRLGPGRYRVLGQRDSPYALPVSKAKGLTIAGTEATIVIANPALACLSLSDCQDCRVSGVTIDYDPPPFTETIVTAIHPLIAAFDVEVVSGYPHLDAPFFSFASPGEVHPTAFGAVFAQGTRSPAAGVTDQVFLTRAERLGSSTFRLQTRDGLPPGLSTGHVFVYLARHQGHALACYRSPRTIVTNVTVRASNGVAFALVQSDRARIEACSVGVDPTSGRLVSANADGVHAQDCRVGPTITHCSFAGMMDDGLNVYAQPLAIRAVTSDGEIVVGTDADLRIGDRLEFSDSGSGRITGASQVASRTPTGSGTEVRVRLASAVLGLYRSTLDGVPDTAFNLSASGEGYVVRGNRYERHRGHAMRLHTGHGVVESNYITQTSREGISVSNDPDWPEGPHTRDLLIRGNTLEMTGGDAAIDVEGRKLGHQLADTATQQNLRINENTVRDWRGSAIAIGAARDVQLHNNLLILSTKAAAVAKNGIFLERAEKVEINGLVVESAQPDAPMAAIEIASTVAPGEAGVLLRNIHVPKGVMGLQDRRGSAPSATPTSFKPHGRRPRLATAVELSARIGPAK